METANQRWSEMLAAWAIPDDLVANAAESPYFFDPALFVAAADEALRRPDDTVSDRMAREALPAGGAVIDVGCGAGAASLRLRAGTIVGVDPNTVLLGALAERAEALGSAFVCVEGVWPDVEVQTPEADVVVCHHVVYNVPNLASFATALDEHAQRRVVIELTAEHPMAWMTPYWEALYGLPQPDRPVAEDAIAVLQGLGVDVRHERWSRTIQMIGETGDDQLARMARRLCLPSERHDELRALLDKVPPPTRRDVVTLWWDPSH